MRAYIRPLGEPNRCLNVYASYDCAGAPRDEAHRPRWYKRAFRRIYILVHGGGKRARIDAELRDAGLRPLNSDVAGLPRAPSRCSGARCRPARRRCPTTAPSTSTPATTTSTGWGPTSTPTTRTGRRSTGCTSATTRSPSRCPSGASPAATTRGYVEHLMAWVKRHERCKMLDLLPGLRILEPLPDPELPGQPRCPQPDDPLEALPPLRSRPPDAAAPAAGRRGPREIRRRVLRSRGGALIITGSLAPPLPRPGAAFGPSSVSLSAPRSGSRPSPCT